MTNEQKNRVRALRKRGFSYKQVADDIGISINTVKSFCRREKGNKDEQPKKMIPSAADGVCKFCGKPLIQIPGQKRKKFCDDKCRAKYWTAHRGDLPHNVTYTFKCAHCGKEFTIYGKRNRKYCSAECYFADRFGEH